MHNLLLCRSCMVKSHSYLFYHKIKEWKDDMGVYSYVYTSLTEMGHSVHLGHGGQQCPAWISRRHGWKSYEMTVCHTNGLHSINVRFCRCQHAPEHWEQLFEHRIFPSSLLQPKTAFTFACLDELQLLNFETRCSVWDYWNMLRRMTNEDNPSSVQVSKHFHKHSLHITYTFAEFILST
jgi:hypothetical protein